MVEMLAQVWSLMLGMVLVDNACGGRWRSSLTDPMAAGPWKRTLIR